MEQTIWRWPYYAIGGKKFKFCAAINIGTSPDCFKKNLKIFEDDVRVHGHNYDLDITIKGEPDQESGFIINISDLKKIVKEKVLDILDHSQIQEDIQWFSNKTTINRKFSDFYMNPIPNDIPYGGLCIK